MNVLINYLSENLLPIGVAVAGAVAWIADRYKRKAELDGVNANSEVTKTSAMQTMQEIYKTLTEQIKVEIDALKCEINTLKKDNNELVNKVKSLEEALKLANTEVENLRKQADKDGETIKTMKAKIESYEKELKIYRKEIKK